MSENRFVHLRLHSEYSITDGIVRIDDAVARAVACAMPALALTDLSNFFGLVKFYNSARGSGVKPVLGCDVFLSNEADPDRPYRMLLLCRSRQGYLQLCELLSRACLAPRVRGRSEITRQMLREVGVDGLIALSGAGLGDVGEDFTGGRVEDRFDKTLPGDQFAVDQQRGTHRGLHASHFPRSLFLCGHWGSRTGEPTVL